MDPDNKSPTSSTYQSHQTFNDETSLVDIFFTIKRNSKLFFGVVLLCLFISFFVTYSNYQSNKIIINSSGVTIEHVLWIEIGKIYGVGVKNGRSLIDSPTNTLEKIKNIYVPDVISKFVKSTGAEINQSSISAARYKNTDLIVIKATKMSDNVDYSKILMLLANDILDDHNKGLSLSNEVISIKRTKVIQKPIKRIIKYNNTNKYKNIILIPVIGILLGMFFGFIVIFIREFFQKVKDIEQSS